LYLVRFGRKSRTKWEFDFVEIEETSKMLFGILSDTNEIYYYSELDTD